MSKIVGVATARPVNRYRQEDILRELQRAWGPRLENPEVAARLHARVGVANRNLVMPIEFYHGLRTWGEANNCWIEQAQELAQESLARALAEAGLARTDLSALYFTSVTGICSPSIDALLVNRMGLSRNIKRLPSFGLGCVGGAALVARASDYVRAFPKETAAVLAVEICSLTVQRDDLSVANLISTALFGDGAAAVLIAGDEAPLVQAGTYGAQVIATRSVLFPDSEDVMGWDISERGFKIQLSSNVAKVIRENFRANVDDFLNDNGLTRDDVGSWVLHTGGPQVLEAMTDALQISRGDIEASWKCLRDTGNISSASVLAVLEEVMEHERPAPGTIGLLAAMGPGFCAELVLLRWA